MDLEEDRASEQYSVVGVDMHMRIDTVCIHSAFASSSAQQCEGQSRKWVKFAVVIDLACPTVPRHRRLERFLLAEHVRI